MMDRHVALDPRYRTYIEHAHRLRARAFTMMVRRAVRGAAKAVLWAGSAGGRLIARFVQWRRRHAAMDQLRGLSDRTLKDIGLHRSQIPSAVMALDQPDHGADAAPPHDQAPADAGLARLAA